MSIPLPHIVYKHCSYIRISHRLEVEFLPRCMLSLHGTLSFAEVLCLVLVLMHCSTSSLQALLIYSNLSSVGSRVPPPMCADTAWYAVYCGSVVFSVDSIAHHRLQASLLHSSLSSWQWSMTIQRSIFLCRCVLILHGTLSTAEVLCLVSILLLIIVYKHLFYIESLQLAVEHDHSTFHLPPPMHAFTAWYAVYCGSVVFSVDSFAHHRLQASLLHRVSPVVMLPPTFIASIFLRRCMLSLHGALSTAKVLCIVSILLLLIVYKHCSYIRISSSVVEHGPPTCSLHPSSSADACCHCMVRCQLRKCCV